MNTVENLRKLADYIEQHVPQDKLDMSWYRRDSIGIEVGFQDHHNCGTSGCALGWAPFVEGLGPVEEDFFKFSNETVELKFHNYSDRVFPELRDCNWNEVFGASLSSDKSEVIQRLRDKANELENQS